MVRRVASAGREVNEEWFVSHQRLLLAHPRDRLIRHVFGEVITFLGGLRRFDRYSSLVDCRVPLIGLAADEAVKVFEAATARRPLVEGTERTGFPYRHFVTLAELRRRVTVQLESHRQRRFVLRQHRSVAGRGRRDLADAAHVNRMVVAPRE